MHITQKPLAIGTFLVATLGCGCGCGASGGSFEREELGDTEGGLGQIEQAHRKSHEPALTITVYIGTYTRGYACPPPERWGDPCVSEGIYRAELNTRTGELSEPVLAAKADNPSYLAMAPDGDHLYAVNEVGDFEGQSSGAVTAFRVSRHGDLDFVNQRPSHGSDPAHVSVTLDGHNVVVANYSGGNVSSYGIGWNGRLFDVNTVDDVGTPGPHPNQDAAHAHYIAEGPTRGLVYVADLGLDRLFLYDRDTRSGELSSHEEQPFVALPPGSGPRHVAVHPNGKFLYANDELSTSVSVFARNRHTGELTEPPLQTVSTIPLPYADRADNGELQISQDGRFVYVSNRGHDSITTFSIDEHAGLLTMIDNVPCGGNEPRDFKIDPTGKFLLVANLISDDIVVFRLDPHTGKPTQTSTIIEVSKPVNFAFGD